MRDFPDPSALFSLVPENDGANHVVNDPANVHRVWVTNSGFGKKAIDVGFHVKSGTSRTLAVIGREGDIFVEGWDISREHCLFEVEGNPPNVVLYDLSSRMSTKFHDSEAKSFLPGRLPRRVLVDPKLNRLLGFGGRSSDDYVFTIIWHRPITDFKVIPTLRDEGQRSPGTITPPDPTLSTRYLVKRELGSTKCGRVKHVVDVDSGNHMALKSIETRQLHPQYLEMLQREVRELEYVMHENIVEYKNAQLEDGKIEIFMELGLGSVSSKVDNNYFVHNTYKAGIMLHDVLKGLDFIHSHGMVHGNVKPENILYQRSLDGASVTYQLTDIQLPSAPLSTGSIVGSMPYTAPEIETNPSSPKSDKMDIWSLFVTMAFVTNAGNIRSKPLHSLKLRIAAVEEAAASDMLRSIAPMAIVDPAMRASAADILDKCFGGNGRSTQRPAVS